MFLHVRFLMVQSLAMKGRVVNLGREKKYKEEKIGLEKVQYNIKLAEIWSEGTEQARGRKEQIKKDWRCSWTA